jgi:hypothetical protein
LLIDSRNHNCAGVTAQTNASRNEGPLNCANETFANLPAGSDFVIFAAMANLDPASGITSNMSAGQKAPETGVYVIMHRDPSHTQPHEVFIARGTILPKCHKCKNVRFSLRSAVQLVRQNEFFRPTPPTRATVPLRSQATGRISRPRRSST